MKADYRVLASTFVSLVQQLFLRSSSNVQFDHLEAYFIAGASADELRATLAGVNLAAYVSFAVDDWAAIYVEGVPLVDNVALLHSTKHLLVHLCLTRENVFSLRAFLQTKGVFEIVYRGNQVLDCSWHANAIPRHLSDRDRVGIDVARTWLKDATNAEATRSVVLSYLNLANQWLNFETLRRMETLPPGIEVIAKVPSPAIDRTLDVVAPSFPAMLYGTHRQVLSQVNAVVSKRSTGKVDCNSFGDTVEFGARRERIFIQALRFSEVTAEEGWRPYVAIQAWLSKCCANTKQEDFRSEVEEVIRCMKEHLWATLGALNQSEAIDTCMMKVRNSKNLARHFLAAFVQWIPEIEAVAIHIAPDLPGLWSFRQPFWAGAIIRVAAHSGWRFTFGELEGKFAGNWREAMLAAGVIVHQGDRYAVSPKFLAK